MHISSFAVFALAGFFVTDALASDVRILSFPESVIGSWAPSAGACKGPERLSISAKQHGTADANCEIAWITVTASREGPVYSARSNCARTTGGSKEAPSYFVVSPRPDDKLAVRLLDAAPGSDMVTYQKCP